MDRSIGILKVMQCGLNIFTHKKIWLTAHLFTKYLCFARWVLVTQQPKKQNPSLFVKNFSLVEETGLEGEANGEKCISTKTQNIVRLKNRLL